MMIYFQINVIRHKFVLWHLFLIQPFTDNFSFSFKVEVSSERYPNWTVEKQHYPFEYQHGYNVSLHFTDISDHYLDNFMSQQHRKNKHCKIHCIR